MAITALTQDHHNRAVDILVRAFHDDPVMSWISDKPGFKRFMFDLILPLFIPHGLSYLDSDGRGAAVWSGPGATLKWPYNLGNFVKSLKLGGPGGLYRFALSGLKTEKYHPTSPHYYLFAIGAVPECQGQGVGTSLIKPILRRCDEEGMPAYLENSKEVNLDFYRGHGFEVTQKIRFSKNAPPLWLMWRDPQ